MIGSTSKVTPRFLVSNAVGVEGVTTPWLTKLPGGTDTVEPRPPVGTRRRRFRSVEFSRIRKLARNADDRLAATLGGNFWSRHQIDAFLLVQGADDDLKLRVREDAGYAKDSGRLADDGGAEQPVDAIGGNRDVGAGAGTGSQTAGYGILTDRNASRSTRGNWPGPGRSGLG